VILTPSVDSIEQSEAVGQKSSQTLYCQISVCGFHRLRFRNHKEIFANWRVTHKIGSNRNPPSEALKPILHHRLEQSDPKHMEDFRLLNPIFNRRLLMPRVIPFEAVVNLTRIDMD
jgi:hypothetical protein